MYIISKQKDYYDGVVGTVGMDKTIVYERQTVEIEDNKSMPDFLKHRKSNWDSQNPFHNVCRASIKSNNNRGYHGVDGFIVGFCGKLYLGWKFYYKEEEFNAELGKPEEVIKEDIIYGYENAKELLNTEYWRSNLDDDVRFVETYNALDVFREYHAPIFLYDGYRGKPRNTDVFYVNPILKDWEFYKVVDAFTAFTELQMFISGVLGTGEKEIIEISNENKIEQHGFDRKWSFRREPTKKC
jgi:hypothetical protein